MAKEKTNQKKYIILFDGTCKLCNNVVRFISSNDSRKIFCFIPLESEKAIEYLTLYKKEKVKKGSMLLIKNDKIYTKSDAVLRILRCLDGLWPLLYAFIIIPRYIRDPVYDIVAKYRYKWFGACVDCPDYTSC